MVRQVQPFLVAYARRRLLDPVAADDVVAETLTIAWRRWGEIPRNGLELPYLYGVASKVLANQKRSLRRQQSLIDRLEQLSTLSQDADPLTDREMRIVAALERIRKPDQEILRLSFWENLSCREIAVVLDCSENAATVRLHRARKRLGDEYRSEFPESAQDTGREGA